MNKMADIILGIDPGSRSTGFGVIQCEGSRYQFITCGTITSNAEQLSDRLLEIFQGMSEILRNYQPNDAAIEQVFFHQNAQSALKLGQARAASMLACAQAGLSVAEYSPRQVKQCVVGYGAAKKEQVGHMICSLLNLPETPQHDAADALAIAISHAHLRTGLATLMKGRGRGRTRRRK